MILWRAPKDVERVVRLVVSLRRLVTAVGAGQAVLEIAAQYAAEHAYKNMRF